MDAQGPRRSPRLHETSRPPYPTQSTPQSTGTSAFNSSSSLSSISSSLATNPSQAQAQMHSSAAPMPSPSTQQTNSAQYFTSLPQQALHAMHPQHQQQQQPPPARGGQPETAPFLNNFSLLAEAAKRAEMACLMRDLGEVEL